MARGAPTKAARHSKERARAHGQATGAQVDSAQQEAEAEAELQAEVAPARASPVGAEAAQAARAQAEVEAQEPAPAKARIVERGGQRRARSALVATAPTGTSYRPKFPRPAPPQFQSWLAEEARHRRRIATDAALAL